MGFFAHFPSPPDREHKLQQERRPVCFMRLYPQHLAHTWELLSASVRWLNGLCLFFRRHVCCIRQLLRAGPASPNLGRSLFSVLAPRPSLLPHPWFSGTRHLSDPQACALPCCLPWDECLSVFSFAFFQVFSQFN